MDACSACMKCGYTTKQAGQNYCPQCGTKLTYLNDEREAPELEQKRKNWKEYEKLRRQFE